MRISCTILLFLIAFVNICAQQIKKTNPPNWVSTISFEDNNPENNQGAYHYLLLDFQDNIFSKEQFAHYAIKVLNADGIQEMSDISTSFDPTFQTLEFHAVKVIRNGEVIDKLPGSTINTYQRETNLERSLYDGSLTAVINLTDIREGDIIEYAYSTKGFNPINKGNYSRTIYQEFTQPVNRIYTKIVAGKENKINYKLLNGALEPKIVPLNSGEEYIWDYEGTNIVAYDNNVPAWYNTQKRVSITTFGTWEEVVKLIGPLYQSENRKISIPITIDQELDSKEDIIIKLIRFVQDEIRYLGFEAGIGAYKPNSPELVMTRRYGDCKDKSLLLTNLLQNQGIESFPMLVNSVQNKNLDEFLPSHYLFDHCIVYFKYGNRDYFVDPTISNQGGDLARLTTPNYNFGLILNDTSKDLVTIPASNRTAVKIVEDIVVDSIGGSATFTVKSEYFGNRADYMRSFFKNNSKENIKKEFLNFYSSLYPTISSATDITYLDDTRPWENIFTINESYILESPWSPMESGEGIYFETYSLVLESLTNYTKSAKRQMPYYVGTPFDFEQTTRISLPEPWNIKDESIVIDQSSFSYKKQVSSLNNLVTISHNYKVMEEHIEGNQVSAFLSKQDELRGNLGYQLYYMNNASDPSEISWLSIIIAVISFCICSYLGLKLYRDYNPEGKGDGTALPIGGWLILPAIGLIVTTFILIYQLFSYSYFSKGIWQAYQNSTFLNLYMGFELFYNIAFLLFTILLIVLFFSKRTSLPILMIYFYGINLAIILIGGFVLNQSGIPNPDFVKDIFKALLSSAIWIPYFLTSNRVKNTFCNVYTKTRPIYISEKNHD